MIDKRVQKKNQSSQRSDYNKGYDPDNNENMKEFSDYKTEKKRRKNSEKDKSENEIQGNYPDENGDGFRDGQMERG